MIRRNGFFDANRDVAQRLAIETLLNLARGHELSLSSGERRIVYAEDHRNRRLVDGNHGQGLWIVGRGDGIADIDVGNAGQCHNFTHARIVGRDALQTFE